MRNELPYLGEWDWGESNQVLTLLSDFGSKDIYVGVMKGVIASINSNLTLVDLTHEIPPQDVAAGRFCLLNAYRYFPPGTVHLAVVDPGVGSRRRSVAVQFDGGFLVGPDNGLLTGVLSEVSIVGAVELTNPEYWRCPEPSHTFHGRDIFAPVAAHLASGVPLAALGRALPPETLVKLDIPPCHRTGDHITGVIQYVDGFGNLITNIRARDIPNQTWSLRVAKHHIPGGKTYSDAPTGQPLALIGSSGWVEIAITRGNARHQLGLKVGDGVVVILN